MPTLLRRALFAALVLALPTVASAQSSVPRKIPPGTYLIVPDPTFAGGIDVSVFTIRFEGDSLMVTEQSGAMMTRSKTSYQGNQLLWTDLEGDLTCPGVAKYTVAFTDEGRTVRLTPVEDGCPERSAIIGQISLKRRS
ncbi:MAG: hypothetical protein ABI910_16795 [Gemmatimonadota bacterium]